MNISKILYPTDLSERSNEALVWATSLARDSDALLVICHVYEPPSPTVAMASHSYVVAASEEEQVESLRRIVPTDPAVRFDHRLVHGTPSDGILTIIESESVDLVVMSTHGRTGLTRLLMGSVAERVVRQARCPVITIKQPSGENVATAS